VRYCKGAIEGEIGKIFMDQSTVGQNASAFYHAIEMVKKELTPMIQAHMLCFHTDSAHAPTKKKCFHAVWKFTCTFDTFYHLCMIFPPPFLFCQFEEEIT